MGMMGFEWIFAAIFLIAALYGSVGHGGASGYLAVLSLMNADHRMVSTTALVLNLFVAGIALWSYWRAGHFSFRLTWPFMIASVPLAFLGGALKLSGLMYDWLLAGVLFAVAIRMCLPRLVANTDQDLVPVSPVTAFLGGGALGFLSGVVGVGGGIFLSPLMIMRRWATPKTTSATAAAFILVNSVAGLAGRWVQGSPMLDGHLGLLVLAGVAGALLGSRYGAKWATNPVLCRLLAVVLLIAAGKMALSAL